MRLTIPGWLAAVLLLPACAGSSHPPQYYVLTPEARTSAPADASGPSIAVGPVSVPDVVDRPRIVLKGAGNEVKMSEYNRWASPLKNEIARVISTNLAQELGNPRVWSYLESSLSDPDVQVVIDVRQFDSILNQSADVDVLWSIKRKGSDAARSGRSTVSEPAPGQFNELVAAHSRALAQVSRDIAKAIRGP
jgi:uncharacterized protein